MDEKKEKELRNYSDAINGVFGTRLKSVALYGSQASGEATKNNSDYNILVIADGLNNEDLKALGKVSAGWVKKNPPPLVFTKKRFLSSADVFPMEFLDMQDNHKILSGEDPFVEMNIDLTNLRHECEFELKGKLLKLRQGYISAAGKPAKIRELMIGSISTFLVLFRNVVRMTGQIPPKKKIDSLDILAAKTKIEPRQTDGGQASPFLSVFKMKEGDSAALKLNPEELFSSYLRDIEKIVDFVDTFVVK